MSSGASSAIAAGSSLKPSDRRPRSSGCSRIEFSTHDFRLEVAYHHQLGERVEAKFDPGCVDRPARFRRDGFAHCSEIFGRSPLIVFWEIGQRYVEISAEALLNGLVGSDVVVTGMKVERGAAQVADQRDGNEDERGFAHDVGLIVLVPAQEADCEEENIDTLLFLRGLRFGQGYEGGEGVGEVLVVFGETTVAAEPGKGSLDDPSAGQHDEAFRVVCPLDDLEAEPRRFGHDVLDLMALQPVSAQTSCSQGKRWRILSSTRVAPSRSCTPAEWTITRSGKPSTSTRACSLRPFTFFPAS